LRAPFYPIKTPEELTLKKTAIKTFSSLLLSASALTSVGFISPALAQTTTATPTEEASDVVIVTARRRDEALQDVPISVTSLSAAALEAPGAPDITVLQQSAPNATAFCATTTP
jgi:iron complex outermembrane receptor protein